MSLHAIEPSRQHSYVPKICRGDPEDEQVRFICKVLTAPERRQLEDESSFRIEGDLDTEKSFTTKRGTIEYLSLRYGLVGWENFTLKGGTAVEFKLSTDKDGRTVASDESIGQIPPEIWTELANYIDNSCRLDEEDEKN